MRFSILLVLCFFTPTLSLSQQCGEADKKWLQCEADQDCTVIQDSCGWPKHAVNKKFTEENLKYNKCRGMAMDCAAYNEVRDGKWTAKCTVKRCIPVKQALDPKIVCEKAGGVWDTFVGRGHVTGCNLPTKDAGKKCERGEDCESVCLKDRTCYGLKEYRGCAFFKGSDSIKCVD